MGSFATMSAGMAAAIEAALCSGRAELSPAQPPASCCKRKASCLEDEAAAQPTAHSSPKRAKPDATATCSQEMEPRSSAKSVAVHEADSDDATEEIGYAPSQQAVGTLANVADAALQLPPPLRPASPTGAHIPGPAACPPECTCEADIELEMDEFGCGMDGPQGTRPAEVHEQLRGEVMSPAAGLIGQYQVLSRRPVGDGGLGVVLPAQHAETNALVALKLGSKEFDPQLGSSDFTWWTFQTEWNCYSALGFGKGHDWMPRAYEAGLYRTSRGIVPWISMELLGPSLHALMEHHRVIGPNNLAPYAQGMITAVEQLHKAGFVHRDVKPANFVCQAGFDGKDTEAPKVMLLDFGFACKWSPDMALCTLDFCGTPDFASTRSMRGRFPSPGCDVEAVAYSLLQLHLQEMPWDLTRPQETAEARAARENAGLVLGGRTRHGGTAEEAPSPSPPPPESSCSGWTEQQLQRMADRKERLWDGMVQRGQLPSFLVQMVQHCRSLPPGALPDYALLHQMIDRATAMPAAASKQQPTAAAMQALLRAEE